MYYTHERARGEQAARERAHQQVKSILYICVRARCTADGNERRSRDKRIKTKELSADSPFFAKVQPHSRLSTHTAAPIPPEKKIASRGDDSK